MALYQQRFGSRPPFSTSSPGYSSHERSRGLSNPQGHRLGRWQQQRSHSQFPQTNSPYASQYSEPDVQSYRSQVPTQSPYRSQYPTNSPQHDFRSNSRPPLPPRFSPNSGRGRSNDRRKRPDTHFSPSKRAYTAYVEDFNSRGGDSSAEPLQSYEDYVCANAMVFSTTASVPEETIEDNPMIQYWSEDPQEVEDDAAAFFASMGAK